MASAYAPDPSTPSDVTGMVAPIYSSTRRFKTHGPGPGPASPHTSTIEWRSDIPSGIFRGTVERKEPAMSIIGIPLGIQAFKMAKLALWPFGANVHGL